MLIPVRSRYHYCLGKTPLTFSVSIILGAPIFLSLPHFKDADPYYLTGIDGLHPEEKYRDYYSYFYLDKVMSKAVGNEIMFSFGFGIF